MHSDAWNAFFLFSRKDEERKQKKESTEGYGDRFVLFM